jgi:outer membrane protein OmpA-like peptidoglycan-associated protein
MERPGRIRDRSVAAAALAFAWAAPFVAAGPPLIPLCPGLTIVTAIAQKDGDYESIKTIESISAQAVVLKYSSERMSSDIFSTAPPKLEHTVVMRSVRNEDLAKAALYLQQYYDKLPETVPGTTAIGTSAAVLRALKSSGEAEIGVFYPFNGTPAASRSTHPNIYDYSVVAKIRRVEPGDVMVPVLVNDRPTELPAIHARGRFFSDQGEFYFLDDPSNPLTLRFSFGPAPSGPAGPGAGNSGGGATDQPKPRDSLRVIKIASRCGASDATRPGDALEDGLAGRGKADVYDIYFDFDSARIRPESTPSLRNIAAVLTRHADWRLAVRGHTDNVGGDAYNLALSQRRADAVKAELVATYGIAPARLTTEGEGARHPLASNATLEGRARNRRVELVRR